MTNDLTNVQPIEPADPTELTIDNVQALQLPPHHETEWSEYYSTWRLRRRLLDALRKADTLGVSYADLKLTQPVSYLHLIKSVRSRVSAKVARNAAQRHNEQRRKGSAKPQQQPEVA